MGIRDYFAIDERLERIGDKAEAECAKRHALIHSFSSDNLL